MNLSQTIEKYFEKNSIIKILTYYELYYQISLGNFVMETLQDIDDTYKKIEELNLMVDPNIAISNIFDIIMHFSHHEDFEKEFYNHIKARAAMQSLIDFTSKDTELLNKEIYIDQKMTMILEQKFFTTNMEVQANAEFDLLSEAYKLLITDNLALEIKENFITSITTS